MLIRKILLYIKELIKYREILQHIDGKYYTESYRSTAFGRIGSYIHYTLYGWRQGYNPAPWFSTIDYLNANSDVAQSGINPFYHYIKYGFKEGRGSSLAIPTSRVGPRIKRFATFTPRKGIDHVQAFRDYLFALNASHASVSFADLIDDLVASDEAAPLLPEDEISLEMHMAAIFDHFDRDYYLQNNPDVSQIGINPLEHYCRFGWRELRRPNADFDLWWYWQSYLNIKADKVDPLLHYVSLGKDRGYQTKNTRPISLRTNAISYENGKKIKRICLFSAYDVHGIVDDYVIDYLKELSKFADIYYLADSEMQPGELNKLANLTKGAWAIRHGEYDFGSYSRLARDLVGWDKIEQYDELILANDSCYLLRPLDHVFEKMDAITTDWWGMQATKGISATRDEDMKRFPRPISLEAIKTRYLNSFEEDYTYNFHVGSYFVVYRKDVINDQSFRLMINSIVKQSNKLIIIKKYEIGFTRTLIHKGYQFHTFVDDLYPMHPIYSESIFTLIEKGFPFIKRFLFAENHYYVPDLAKWKPKITAILPEANLNVVEKNLYRVSNAEKLYNNFRIRRDVSNNPVYPKLYSNSEIVTLDANTPKYDNWWAFPVCAFDHTFSGNERAVFEQVRYNKYIKKIILTRSKYIDIDGENVEICPLKSKEGQEFLLRSKIIFIKHTVERNINYPLNEKLHHFIELWHGIPLKRIGYASLDLMNHLQEIADKHRRLRAVISSSKVDQLAMAAGFYPLSYHDVWLTGLPRNDFIIREFNALPDDLKSEELRLRKVLNGRKLILFCPTFRNGTNGKGYVFNEDEVTELRNWLRANNAMLGIREHMADKFRTYSIQLTGEEFLDVSSRIYPNIEILFRVSSALVTDYSSCFVDYILTGKHLVSFAYDMESYKNSERGLFYDMEFCFPGDICHSFHEVLASLKRAADCNFRNTDPAYDWKKKLFFEFDDDKNSERVVNRVKELIGH